MHGMCSNFFFLNYATYFNFTQFDVVIHIMHQCACLYLSHNLWVLFFKYIILGLCFLGQLACVKCTYTPMILVVYSAPFMFIMHSMYICSGVYHMFNTLLLNFFKYNNFFLLSQGNFL